MLLETKLKQGNLSDYIFMDTLYGKEHYIDVPIYAADFETTTNEDDCRVWLWCIVNIDNEKDIHYGTNIETFFDLIATKNATYYFHNLKFDGKFCLDHAIRNLGFTQAEETKIKGGRTVTKREENTFSTIISDDDVFYDVTFNFAKKRNTYYVARLRDSMKKFGANVSVDDIAHSYEVGEIQKLKIDYHKANDESYVPEQLDYDYITNDVLIVARALKILMGQGLKALTIGSDALKYYKTLNTSFLHTFPILGEKVDAFIRKAYKGGYCNINKHVINKEQFNGSSYDVNSLYPYCMTLPLPFGVPIKYRGKYKHSDLYPLYIQHIRCDFVIKDGYLPTIQLKNNSRYMPTQYIEQSERCENGNKTDLWLTSTDLELFFDHYHVFNEEYIEGYMFQSSSTLFTDYIEHWYDIKCNSSGSVKQLAKLMLNNLYGKFAQSLSRRSKSPYIDDEDGILHFKLNPPEQLKPIYTAVAAFVTSYGRNITIRTAQSIGGNKPDSKFFYCDTDSIHCKNDFDIASIIDIDSKRLGAWKHEYDFGIGRYIRPKAYIECIADGNMIIKCSGMTDKMKFGDPDEGIEPLKYEDFKVGYEGTRLRAKTVKGGVVLVDSPFSIKGQ